MLLLTWLLADHGFWNPEVEDLDDVIPKAIPMTAADARPIIGTLNKKPTRPDSPIVNGEYASEIPHDIPFSDYEFPNVFSELCFIFDDKIGKKSSNVGRIFYKSPNEINLRLNFQEMDYFEKLFPVDASTSHQIAETVVNKFKQTKEKTGRYYNISTSLWISGMERYEVTHIATETQFTWLTISFESFIKMLHQKLKEIIADYLQRTEINHMT
eukprot:NODE_498_length_6794_cov_0.318250.p4 type:complete len:213 gc:universal NODE_498_length_6794_cov_0.318250:4697-5335(+)